MSANNKAVTDAAAEGDNQQYSDPQPDQKHYYPSKAIVPQQQSLVAAIRQAEQQALWNTTAKVYED